MYKGKKILVTGGFGYLGSYITKYFNADPVSRRNNWDLTSLEKIKSRIDKYDIIIHLASLTNKNVLTVADFFHINSEGTYKLSQALQKGQTLIYSSTKDVYNANSENYLTVPESCSVKFDTQSIYGWSKLIGEEYLRYFLPSKGVRLGIFRLSTIFAPRNPEIKQEGGWLTGFAQTLRQGKPLILKRQGKQIRDILPVSELSRAFDLFINSGTCCEIFNIGGGIKYSSTLIDFAHCIAKAIKVKTSASLIKVTDELITTEQIKYISNLNKIKNILGWEPDFNINNEFSNL